MHAHMGSVDADVGLTSNFLVLPEKVLFYCCNKFGGFPSTTYNRFESAGLKALKHNKGTPEIDQLLIRTQAIPKGTPKSI